MEEVTTERLSDAARRGWERRRAREDAERERVRAERERDLAWIAAHPDAQLLTLEEAARRAGYRDSKTLSRACRDGHLRAVKLSTAWVVRPRDLERFLARRRWRERATPEQALAADILGRRGGERLPEVPDPEAFRAAVALALAESPSPQVGAVLNRVYGLDGREPATQSDLAREMGVSRQAVSQVRKEGLARLRWPANRERIEATLGR